MLFLCQKVKDVVFLTLKESFICETNKNFELKNEKNVGINTSFLKKSREKRDYFVKNREKSPSLSEDFDQISDSGDAVFWFHLSNYQAIVIYRIDSGVVILVIWSFVKIENGFGQNRHYNIKIYFYIIVSRKCVFQIENDK